jgi:chromosomal replication initiation ATPase DnaA
MITKEQALQSGADAYEIPYEVAERRWRSPRSVRARWHAWELMRQDGWTLQMIADAFRIHHTSVIHGLQRIKGERE